MQFVIFGAGAIGCYVGARLALYGEQVCFVGRAHITDVWLREGLRVSDLEGFSQRLAHDSIRTAPSLAAAMTQNEDDDVADPRTTVLLCVKGGATLAAADELAQVCPAGTVVVSLQNGVDNVERIRARAPQLKVLAGMVPYNVVMPHPSAVHRASSGMIQLQNSAMALPIAEHFFTAGLPTALAKDMRAVQWGKLLLNLNNPVNALSNLPLREELMDRDCRWVLAALQTEALRALKKAGIRPANVGAAPPWLLPWVLRLPSPLFRFVAERLLDVDASARSSMWDDFQRGRPTEINDLCGAVVRLAQSVGLQAPRNAAMVALIARHQKGQSMSGSRLRAMLG